MIEPVLPIFPATSISASDPVARLALRKASFRLLPVLALGYGIAFIDRANISYASLRMNQDLHFTATIYGLGAGLFFLAYAACEVPSNLLLYRFGARSWLSRIMVTWGAIAMAMIFVRTPVEFYITRFLLGMAEAGFFPGVIFYLMLWFPPELRARSVARFYVAIPLSGAVMGFVAGGLLGLNGRLGFRGWQWLFLVEALPAVLLGLVFFFYLPDGPSDAKWLTEAERYAILVLAQQPPRHSRESVGPILRDPRVWLLGLFHFCMLCGNYAFLFSAPAVIQKITGFTVTRVGFLMAGMNLLGAAAMIVGGIVSDRRKRPVVHILCGSLAMALGFIVSGLSNVPVVALSALLLILLGNFSMQGPLWAVSTSFLSGRSAAAAIATINTVGMIGGFVGPYWMGFARDLTGSYQRGLLTTSVPLLVAASIILCLQRWAIQSTSTPVSTQIIPTVSALDSPTL